MAIRQSTQSVLDLDVLRNYKSKESEKSSSMCFLSCRLESVPRVNRNGLCSQPFEISP